MKAINSFSVRGGRVLLGMLLAAWLTPWAWAQNSEFYHQSDFRKTIKEPAKNWHRVPIDIDVLEKVNENMTDIRVAGFLKADTTEVGYVLHSYKSYSEQQVVYFDAINESVKDGRFFITYEQPLTKETINEITLNIDDENFSYLANLEGSQDGKTWFSILENYRIVGINDEHKSYKFTTLRFPNSNYKYYRISLDTKGEAKPFGATLLHSTFIQGDYHQWSSQNPSKSEGKSSGTTVFEYTLQQRLPFSAIAIEVADDFEYHRSITISYLADSSLTPKGEWIPFHVQAYTGVLSSYEKNRLYELPKTIFAKKIRIEVRNQNNPPLNLGKITVYQPKQELLVRFDKAYEQAELLYGGKALYYPDYDINKFVKDLSISELPLLSLGAEEKIDKPLPPKKEALFENPIWLWSIMGIVILLLGFFALRLLK
jgi:hypothetical protein